MAHEGNGNDRYLILGAGLAGLAAGQRLGGNATVLECEDRAGGMVRSVRIGDYWFDRTMRLLYFDDPETEGVSRDLTGSDLHQFPWTAWVETLKGTCRYPFQMNLSSLDAGTIIRCLHDLAKTTFTPRSDRSEEHTSE